MYLDYFLNINNNTLDKNYINKDKKNNNEIELSLNDKFKTLTYRDIENFNSCFYCFFKNINSPRFSQSIISRNNFTFGRFVHEIISCMIKDKVNLHDFDSIKNSLIETEGTGIISLPPDGSYISNGSTEKPTLKDYVIKSSYNSAVTGKNVNIDMVKYLLTRGVRLLDFEVLLIDDKPMITYTNDNSLETIETNNTLLLDNVFSMLATTAFVQPTPN